jgi:hypothetical protein
MEHTLEKHKPSAKTCLLGDLKWRKCIVLAGLMATTKTFESPERTQPP